MPRQLTGKQNKFIDGVVSGLSYAEAYRRAYNAKNMAIESIAKKSSEMANRVDIRGIIDQRKKELANKAIWGREQALALLRDIALQARDNAIVTDDSGDKAYYNAAASSAAIRAIEQANKMCGYNEPEKVDVSGEIKVVLSDELEKWAK